jgi:hypothetical protein
MAEDRTTEEEERLKASIYALYPDLAIAPTDVARTARQHILLVDMGVRAKWPFPMWVVCIWWVVSEGVKFDINAVTDDANAWHVDGIAILAGSELKRRQRAQLRLPWPMNTLDPTGRQIFDSERYACAQLTLFLFATK